MQQIKYDPRPTICPLCGGSVFYGKMTDFQIRPFQSGWCYLCTNCKAYVATHKNRPKDALGMLAEQKTRKLRVLCHEELDKHYFSTRGKNRAYYRLAKEMGISEESCHFGYMNEQQLQQAYEILCRWENISFR